MVKVALLRLCVCTLAITIPAVMPKSFPMVPTSSQETGYENVCLDNSRCPSEYSCQKSSSGYSCCPLVQGVGCSDGKHCCPEGHQCSEDGNTCVSNKVPVTAIICPNESYECPLGMSCSQLPDNSWGCCPMPKAVSCKDGVHCCSEGTNCSTEQYKCLSPSYGEMPMWKKVPARMRAEWEYNSTNKKQNKVGNVTCDSTHSCPDGTTCCQRTTGEWACCPLPQAVCCDDGLHCCPTGTTCNLAAGTCDSSTGSVGLLEKLPAFKKQQEKAGDVTCDSTHSCPDGSTCCKTKTGEWACCPLPQAVCCNDGVHCCPTGTTCNLAAGKCDNSTGSVGLLEKLPALKKQQDKAGNVMCDSIYSCPDGSTCCKSKAGEWTCCPLPQAVCCDDDVHCCPTGTTCNLAAGKCDNSTGSVGLLDKLPAFKKQQDKAGDVTCDSTHSCPDGSTCCKTKTGEWACCPLPQAVCCDDGVHCCPTGTTCNLAAGKCDNSTGSVSLLEKLPAFKKQQDKAGDVTCDSTHSCPDGSTCCKTKTGEWACCPLPQAVCCDDGVHCCPTGTTCNLAAGKCDNSTGSVGLLEKLPALKKQQDKAGNVMCDAIYSCPDGSTCCKSKAGDWTCCPLPQAVCCDDDVHCCPTGTTCNLAAGKCDNSTGSVDLLEKLPAFKTKESGLDNTPCGPDASCPKGTTCCFRKVAGKWGCCPLPKAVCCADGDHCCPAGYKCNEDRTTCSRGEVVIPWYNKIEALSSQSPSADGKCDAESSCEAGTTCCQFASGRWGCCSHDQGTCCPDQEHCCPKGYTCNSKRGTCEKLVGWLIHKVSMTQVSALRDQPAVQTKYIQCDAQSSCKEGETCCTTTTPGTWACCPYPQAVCCSDMKHCCPTGYTCDLLGGFCTRSAKLGWDRWNLFFSRRRPFITV